MTNEKQLTPAESFQEKIFNKLRDDVGNLMSEEMLAELLEKAIDKMFFAPQIKVEHGYNKSVTEKPSWFVEHVTTKFDAQINSLVVKWLSDNEDKLTALAEKVITEQMPAILAMAIFKGIDNSFNNRMATFEHSLMERIQYNIKNGIVV